MASLPIGWGDRNNAMSEHDMKLGGDAQNKFANKNAYEDEGGTTYKTTDEVKAFYMKKIEKDLAAVSSTNSSSSTTTSAAKATTSSTPFGWESRQRSKEAEAMQLGVFSRNGPSPIPTASVKSSSSLPAASAQHATTNSNGSSGGAEAAIVRIATHTLDTMADTLERNPVELSADERAAFAAAMMKAMNAIAKCK